MLVIFLESVLLFSSMTNKVMYLWKCNLLSEIIMFSREYRVQCSVVDSQKFNRRGTVNTHTINKINIYSIPSTREERHRPRSLREVAFGRAMFSSASYRGAIWFSRSYDVGPLFTIVSWNIHLRHISYGKARNSYDYLNFDI